MVPFDLLLAGIAAPAAFAKLFPRWLVVAGLALGVAAKFSSLTLVVAGASVLIPTARFGGLVWLITAGVLLPRGRAASADRPREAGQALTGAKSV